MTLDESADTFNDDTSDNALEAFNDDSNMESCTCKIMYKKNL